MFSKLNKSVFGWAVYDWANSAFSTVVMAGFFPIFFKQYWSLGVDSTVSTARLGVANSVAGLGVALMAPVLGAMADKGSARKRFLFFFAFMGIVMTACLSLLAKGQWGVAIFVYVMATVGFQGGNVFYDAFLSVVASRSRLDFVSALGYSLGYLGGGVLFAFTVWMTLSPQTFGLADSVAAVKVSFLCVSVWWALFSVPLFLFVKEPEGDGNLSGLQMVKAGFRQVIGTCRDIRRYKPVFIFLCAYWLYIDGVHTIIRMAVDYGLSIGFQANDLIIALLIVQFIGFPAALAFGMLGGKIGTRRAIGLGICGYLFISIWGALIHSKLEFYALAVMIGLFQGGIQALSRSYFATLIPLGKSAQFFGFFNMIGRFAVVLGPVLMGGVAVLIHGMGYSSDLAARLSIVSLMVFFIAGGLLLGRVKNQNF